MLPCSRSLQTGNLNARHDICSRMESSRSRLSHKLAVPTRFTPPWKGRRFIFIFEPKFSGPVHNARRVCEPISRERSRSVFTKFSQIQCERHLASEPTEFFERASGGDEFQSFPNRSGNTIARRLLRPSEKLPWDLNRDLPPHAHPAQLVSIDTIFRYD